MDKITGLDQVSQDFDLLITKASSGFIYPDKNSIWILEFGNSRPKAKQLGSFRDKLSAVKAARGFGFGEIFIQNHPKKKRLNRFSFEDERDWSRIYSASLR